MRKEDEQAIKRTIALVKHECAEHQLCKQCRLYITGKGCIVDTPPQFLDADAIIECFT